MSDEARGPGAQPFPKVRRPLGVKIGLFAAALVACMAAAMGVFAIWQPAQRARLEKNQQYRKLAVALGASGALPFSVLGSEDLDPDLAYVLRLRGGLPVNDASVVHEARLGRLDPSLAAAWGADPKGALKLLAGLSSGDRPDLEVRRVNLKLSSGDEQLVFGFSSRALTEELHANLVWGLAALVLGMAAAMTGAFLLSSRLARPARELAQAMARTGQGRFETVPVTSDDELGLLTRAFNEMSCGLEERERLKATLARYVSDDVAERILTERSDLDLKGELRQVTVLFLDVRGFTALSEKLPARDVVQMLNEYFEIIIDVMFKYEGTINKFIGDAVMAIYGAPRELPDPAMRAVRTAIEIRDRLAEHNAARARQGLLVIDIGIGINTGEAIAGNVGSARRLEYTVIGDDVNLAQRLESNARVGEILISHSTFLNVEGRILARSREPLMVKGRAAPVQVYEVAGLSANAPERAAEVT